MTIHVRRAAAADAPRLSQLGATTFRETFEGENTPEDMARYLAEAFTPDQQAAEIIDPAGTVLLAEHRVPSGDAELVGYAHLVSGPAPEAVRGPAPLELKRLYVSRAWHGQGVAQALMDAVLDAARARGAQTLWLGVWERNPRAAAFYAKYGFVRVGEHTFMLGADAQTDWLLARPPGAVQPSSRGASDQRSGMAVAGASNSPSSDRLIHEGTFRPPFPSDEATMKLDIYLNYRGDCEEAFRFYERELGGRIIMMMRHREGPEPSRLPAEWHDKILHAHMEIGGTALLGADIPNAEPMRSAYLALTADSAEDAERLYALLAEGGQIFMKMEETFFATRFAMLRDRFGTSWMLTAPREGADRPTA